jgi:hypothetical protein
VKAEPVVLLPLLPALQLDHEAHALRQADGGDAVEIPDIEDPESAQLHVVARQIRRGPHQGVPHLLDLDDIVRHQPMSAVDQLEGALGLADPAVAEDERAQSEDVEEDGVEVKAGGETLFQEGGEELDECRGLERGREKGHARGAGGRDQLTGRGQALGQHEARDPAPAQLRENG